MAAKEKKNQKKETSNDPIRHLVLRMPNDSMGQVDCTDQLCR